MAEQYQYLASPIIAIVDRTDPLFVDVKFHTRKTAQCSLTLKITGQILQAKPQLFYIVPNDDSKERIRRLFRWIAAITMYGNEDADKEVSSQLTDSIFITNTNPETPDLPGTQYFKVQYPAYDELVLHLPKESTASVGTPEEKASYLSSHGLIHECTFQANFIGALLTNNTSGTDAVLYAEVTTNEITFGDRKAPIPFYRHRVIRRFQPGGQRIPLRIRNKEQQAEAQKARRAKMKALRDKRRSQMDQKEYDDESLVCQKFVYPATVMEGLEEIILPVQVNWNPFEPVVGESSAAPTTAAAPAVAATSTSGEGGVQTVSRPVRARRAD